MSDALNRRQFIAAGSLAAAAASASADEKAPPKPAPVDVTLAQVVLQYPSGHLDEAALREIRDDIQQHHVRSAFLSAYPLQNGDEPGFIFAAYRRD